MTEALLLLRKTHEDLPPTIPCDTVLREGLPAEEIVAFAREQDVNLIVLGSRGRNRFAEFVLGSTAEAVIRDAPCPVMTVSHAPRCCSFSQSRTPQRASDKQPALAR